MIGTFILVNANARRDHGRRFVISLCAALLAAGCEAKGPAGPPVVPVPLHSAPELVEAQPNRTAFREGIRLRGVEGLKLHPVEGALLASASAGKDGGRRVYVVRGDALDPEPTLTLRPGMADEGLLLAGRYPDRLFALAEGRDASGFTRRLLRSRLNGWNDQAMPEKIYDIVSWSGALIGLARDKAVPLDTKLVRIDPPGADIPIPPGAGPVCDAFYAGPGSAFPRRAVQARRLVVAARTLLLLGVGCDLKMGALAWAEGSSEPQIHALDERTFFDGLAGTITGRDASDLYWLRPPMRPASMAVLWHYDGARWSKIEWPSEDPEVDSIAVDEGRALWAAINGKLYRRKDGQWAERKLPEGCEGRSVAVLDTALWIACDDAAARISLGAPP